VGTKGRTRRRLTLAVRAAVLKEAGMVPDGLGVALTDTTAGLVQTFDPSTSRSR
jgi:hypothetical protein